MIQVETLRKIYKSRRARVVALDGVSFTLPDKGLVFVVGKSGSGKSTLLNLLGGLDKATSGEIYVDGLRFSELKSERNFDGYRAEYLGFVFQDFHLIDKLTVKENVALALDLKCEKNAALVSEALKEVGLEGYEDRYPAEMSGGQQQRVAIARAIVKAPRLILADEPTGNLDSLTSKQALDLLKELSRDRLVVAVSHNMEAAYEYADRIIELGDGRIVRDVARRSDEDAPLIADGVISLPENSVSEEDIDRLNTAMGGASMRFARRKSRFVDVAQLNAQGDSAKADGARPAALQNDDGKICASSELSQNGDGQEEKTDLDEDRTVDSSAYATKSDAHKIEEHTNEARDSQAHIGGSQGNATGKKMEVVKGGRKPLRSSLPLSFKLLRKGTLAASVLVASFLIVLFVICMTLYVFDGGEVIRDAAVNEEYPVIFQQQNKDVGAVGIRLDKVVKVEDGAEQAIRDAGYKGKIYKLINMGVPVQSGSSNLENAKLLGGMEMYKDVYCAEGLGVLIADEEYLHKYFGDFEVLSGSLDADPYGIILTDYLADSMLYYDPTMVAPGEDPYAKLIKIKHLKQRIKINAVISTGYKQKYAEMFDKYKEITSDGIVTAAERNEITGSDMFIEFYKDAQSRLNIAYTIDPDYMQAVIDNPEPSKYFARCLNAEVEVGGEIIYNDFNGYGICASTISNIPELQRGEAYVSVNFYNNLFGTEFTAENIKNNFEEKSFTVREYATNDVTRQQPLYEKTFTVKGIYAQNEYMFISDEDFVEMRQFDVFAYALVLDDKDNIDRVMSAAEELDLMPNATLYSDLLLLTKVMNVYKDVFLALALVLLGAVFLTLVSFAAKSVNGRVHEIGIIRALGASQAQMTPIFLLQIALACLLICAIEIAGQFALVKLTNALLTASLAAFMHNGIFKGMTLISFNPVVTLISLIATVVVTLCATLIPLLKLSRIKPIEILRKND